MSSRIAGKLNSKCIEFVEECPAEDRRFANVRSPSGGVFENFNPHLPVAHRDTPFVLLANIASSLQAHVLAQVRRPKFVVADTLDLWIHIAMDDLLRLLQHIDVYGSVVASLYCDGYGLNRTTPITRAAIEKRGKLLHQLPRL